MSCGFPSLKCPHFYQWCGHLARCLDFSPWRHRKLPLSILYSSEIPSLLFQNTFWILLLGLISISKSLLYHCCLPFDCFPVCLWSLPTLYSQHNVQVWFKTQTDLLPLLLKGLPLVPILFKGSESRGKEETVREGKGAWGGETEGMESRYDRLERSCLFETQHYTINVCH